MRDIIAVMFFGLVISIGLKVGFNNQETKRISNEVNEIKSTLNQVVEALDVILSNPSQGSSAIQIEQTGRTVAHEDLDVFCLAKNIFHEAGIEDELGMFAVAQVTINRVRNANYPNRICDVVMQPSQFTWANDKSRRWTHPSGPKWDLSKRIARQVVKEGYRVPALQSAIYYHADYANPKWRDPDAVIAHIGTHIFYASAR
jgi:N-acetylmuramoyl-L-alanine amidase